jgi:Amt family ammonium transporter
MVRCTIYYRLGALGYKDFAGAGYLFYAAGVAALVITSIVKPRKYRFEQN